MEYRCVVLESQSGYRLVLPSSWDHPSYEAVRTMNEVFNSFGGESRIVPRRIWRLIGKPVSFARLTERVVVPMVGLQTDTLLGSFWYGRPVVWAWDVWPSELENWVTALNKYRVDGIMVTSTDSADLLKKSDYEGKVFYIPDAIRVADFSPGANLTDRQIHVLELGRRHNAWSEEVRPKLKGLGLAHLFEASKGDLIFPDRPRMLRGLSNSAVSVCFPRSMSHPESAGGVEALTQRYLESIASGCLVLGRAPKDLVDLFGCNPVIEANMRDPAGQIEDILENLGDYQELVNRNLDIVREVGDWSTRFTRIERHVQECGL